MLSHDTDLLQKNRVISQKIPRCSLPWEGLDRYSNGAIANFNNCALSQWCTTEGHRQFGTMREFQELVQIHAQLHLITHEIVFYESIHNSSRQLYAIKSFQDLWHELRLNMERLDQMMGKK